MGQKVEAISKNLDKEGLVEISYNSDTEIWDRGECRVQAYSGNPVKIISMELLRTRWKKWHCR